MDDSPTAFVAVYVRKLLSDPERRQDLVDTLSHGHPYVVQEEMAIAMIHVSGYSALTTKLFEALGKVSSEVVSQAIGDYVGKVSSVVMEFGGDIIKFLGHLFLAGIQKTPSRRLNTEPATAVPKSFSTSANTRSTSANG
ncbi:hypothetical protein HDU96_001962 [Phlyctochytrium bullatum]|nr:hypothetical protein HDU96_001962 [Phlyctochytrium bullatum]